MAPAAEIRTAASMTVHKPTGGSLNGSKRIQSFVLAALRAARSAPLPFRKPVPYREVCMCSVHPTATIRPDSLSCNSTLQGAERSAGM